MTRQLNVYLSEVLVGQLTEEPDRGGRDYRFRYSPEIAEKAAGLPVLSASLPGQADEFDPIASRPFFEGLLPELALRTQPTRRN